MPRAGICEQCGKWSSVLSPKYGKMMCRTCRFPQEKQPGKKC